MHIVFFKVSAAAAVWLFSLIWRSAEQRLWLIRVSNWPCDCEKREHSGEAVNNLALTTRTVIVLQTFELICESAPLKANVLAGFVDPHTWFHCINEQIIIIMRFTIVALLAWTINNNHVTKYLYFLMSLCFTWPQMCERGLDQRRAPLNWHEVWST